MALPQDAINEDVFMCIGCGAPLRFERLGSSVYMHMSRCVCGQIDEIRERVRQRMDEVRKRMEMEDWM